jgi:hypothetical protein
MDTRLMILMVFIGILIGACASNETNATVDAETTLPASADTTQEILPANPMQNQDTGVYLSEGVFDGFLLGKWTFDISVDVMATKANKTRRGNIIELKDDFTYEVTQKGDIVETGKFEYNRTREFLIIRPSDADPSEWKVSMLGNSLLWASTERFKNKGTQIRLFQGAVELEDL